MHVSGGNARHLFPYPPYPYPQPLPRYYGTVSVVFVLKVIPEAEGRREGVGKGGRRYTGDGVLR